LRFNVHAEEWQMHTLFLNIELVFEVIPHGSHGENALPLASAFALSASMGHML